MIFTKKQTLILFSLVVCVLVLISVLVLNFNKIDDVQNTDSQQKTLISEVEMKFNETTESTNIQKELDSISDLNIFEKAEKFKNEPTENLSQETDEPDNPFTEDELTTNYQYTKNGIYVSTYSLSELGKYNPNAVEFHEQYKINSWVDGTVVYKDTEIVNIGDGRFALHQEDLSLYNSVTYLQKDGVFFYLGYNIENVYQFTINNYKMWISFIENDYGSKQLYISGPFFSGLQRIEGVFYQTGNVYQNGNFLMLDNTIFGMEEVKRAKYRVDIKGIAESKVLDDYSQFVTLEQ